MATKKKALQAKKSTHHIENNVPQSFLQSARPPQSVLKKIMRFVGWGIVYVVVFYLGNLTGEYVASHLPILPKLPRITWDASVLTKSIPKVNFSWPKPNTPIQPTTVPQAQLVIVNGQMVNMPLAAATDDQRKAYRELIAGMAVDAAKVTVTSGCSVDPGFFRVKQGARIDVVNTTSEKHEFDMADTTTAVEANKTTSVVFSQSSDTYPLFCDGSIVGFFIVE